MQQILIPIGSLIVGMFLGAWFSLFLSRPKLEVSGGGGGGGIGSGVHVELQIRNAPGLFGIRIDQTILFGKQIHRPIEWGLSVDRRPANQCSARLLDKATQQFIAPLVWVPLMDPTSHTHEVAVASGQQYRLMLLARVGEDYLRYFPYRPKGPQTLDAEIPVESVRFSDDHDFIVRIDYSYGRQALKIP